MDRRNFMKTGLGLGAGVFLPAGFTTAMAKTQEGSFVSTLAIPPIVQPDAQGVHWIIARQGASRFKNNRTTPTWGYNGNLLGPVLRAQRGSRIKIAVKNTLNELSTVHWHGLEIPGTSDGGPHEIIQPSAVWQTQFDIDQAAATCWFHPHTHNETGRHVAMGLGGLFLIEDESAKVLNLPSRWGIDDIPVILQDKRLNAKGEVDYQLDMMSAAVGWFGDVMLTNGAVMPFHRAPQGFVRLRLLNACNARSLNVGFSDSRDFYVIASDGGLLEAPIKLSRLDVYPGERFEIMVQIKGDKPVQLMSFPVRQIGMTLAPFDQPLPVLQLQPAADSSSNKLPDTLAKIPSLPNQEKLAKLSVRKLQLSMDATLDRLGMMALMERYGSKAMAGMDGAMGDTKNTMMHGSMKQGMKQGMGSNKDFNFKEANFINGKAFDMNKPAFNVPVNTQEIWEISGVGDMMRHPFHIHGAQFRILQENNKPALPHRQGRKDIVLVEGAVSRVLVEFGHKADSHKPYMAHCHLLEHEDTGMMLGFTVD